MPIQIGNTDINQLLNDSRIGMGNQFNPVEAIYSGGGGGGYSNIWNRSIFGTITPITISDKLGLGTSTFIGSERLRVLGETNTDTLRTQTGYLDTLRLRNNSSYLAITAPVTTSRTITFQDKDGTVALLSDTQSLPNYALVSTYTQTNSAISGAVTNSHTHSNKALLDTYNQTNSDLTSAVSLRHSHSNKALLDTYTNSNADITTAITNNHSHSNKALLDTYTQTNSNITLAVTNQHTHSNKALLDSYSNTNTDIATAITNSHTHSNKTLLDSYTQTEVDLADAVTKKHAHTNLVLLETYDQTNVNITSAITNSHTHANKAILDGVINSGSGTTFLSDAGDYRSVSVAPVGTDTQVVFNDGGTTLSGDSGLVFNKTTNLLTAGILQSSSTVNIEDTATYLSKNGGGDLLFTDTNSGSVSLATLVAGNTNYWTAATGGILYTSYVGINNPLTLDEALTVNGNIQATDFNSSYIRYKNSNILIGPNAGDLETGNNKVIIANSNTSTPLFYGEIDNQLAAFYADVYIYGAKTLNFGSAVNRIYWTSGNNLTFQDANADSGNAISLSDLRDGTYYSLVGAFTDYNAVKSITTANKSTWNRASILTTSGSATDFLGADGAYHAGGGGGVTPTDFTFKWDTGSLYYRPYTDKTEAGGVSSGGKFYGGTSDPTNSNRLNYDGILCAFGFYGVGATIGGIINILNNSTSSGTGISTGSYNGYGISAYSTLGVSAVFSNSLGNTSDIAKFQLNSVDQCVINSSGINLITGSTYKVNGVDILAAKENSLGNPGTNGYVLSSTTGGTRSWIANGVTPIDGIFDWDGTAYNPYAVQTTGKFDSSTTDPSHSTRLNYDGILYTTSSYNSSLHQVGIGTTNNLAIGTNSLSITMSSATKTFLNPGVTDGSSATAYILDTNNALSLGNLLSLRTNNTDKFAFHSTGYLNIFNNSTNYSVNQYNYYSIYYNNTIVTKLTPSVADGASSIAYLFDTSSTLSTSGAKLTSYKNNTVEKASIDKDGYIYIGSSTTDGCWRFAINSNNLNFERRESGSWVMKGQVLA